MNRIGTLATVSGAVAFAAIAMVPLLASAAGPDLGLVDDLDDGTGDSDDRCWAVRVAGWLHLPRRRHQPDHRRGARRRGPM